MAWSGGISLSPLVSCKIFYPFGLVLEISRKIFQTLHLDIRILITGWLPSFIRQPVNSKRQQISNGDEPWQRRRVCFSKTLSAGNPAPENEGL